MDVVIGYHEEVDVVDCEVGEDLCDFWVKFFKVNLQEDVENADEEEDRCI